MGADFDGGVEITSLVVGIEVELLSEIDGGVHAFKQSCPLRLEVRVELSEEGCQVTVVGSVQM